MKPATVFLGEMTNPEVEAFLKTRHTVIVPTGATEQHGPHGPLLTDVLIPQEVARRSRRRLARSWRRPSTMRCRIRTLASQGWFTSASRRSWRSSRICASSFASLRLQAHHLSQRPLRQHLRDRLRLRECRRQAAERRQGVSGELLGRADGRRDRRVVRAEERAARQPRRDLGRAGHQSEPGRYGTRERGVPAVPGIHA